MNTTPKTCYSSLPRIPLTYTHIRTLVSFPSFPSLSYPASFPSLFPSLSYPCSVLDGRVDGQLPLPRRRQHLQCTPH
ncbi:hypothetical protein Lalb_Chr21g0308611 [Lupinus albus]|uniref:Uncharacterized protein n=1 Tax=Lupinus albus TaxID=3870 RepID=A0A6A4NIZ9_LUPAL|nr:hypothetical protein Lalb_Chr21g0308611 [Lupinus albus]